MVTIPVAIEFSVIGASNVTTAFNNATNSTNRLNTSARNAAESTAGFRGKLDELAKSVRLIEGPLGGTAARLQTLVGVIGKLNPLAAGFVIGVAAIVGTIALLGPKLVAVRLEFDRIINTLKSVTSSTSMARAEFSYITEVSKQYGLELGATATQYAKLVAAARGTSLEGEATRRVFEATAVSAAALGLSTDQTAGVLLAFQQMLSKGTVQAEELRGQLGERLPGAFNLAAQAMGVTTQKLGEMLKSGSVLANDLLPKLAEKLIEFYGPGAVEGANSLNAATNRLTTSWKMFLDVLGTNSGIISWYKNRLEDIARALDVIRKFLGPAVVDTGASAEIPPLPITSTGISPLTDMGFIGPTVSPFQPNSKLFPEDKTDEPIGEAADYFMRQDALNRSLEKRDDILGQLQISADSLRFSMTDLLTPQEKYNAQMLVLEQTFGPGGIQENMDLFVRGQKKLNEQLYATDPLLRSIGSGFDDLGETVARSMTTASNAMEAFQDVARGVLESVLEGILQLLVFDPIKSAVLGGVSSLIGGGTNNIVGTPMSTPIYAQYGASFDVPGVGGVDNKYVGLMMSPGEQVDITPRDKKTRGGGGDNIFYMDNRGVSDEKIARLEQLVHSVNGSVEPRAIAAVYNASRNQPTLFNRKR